MPAVDHPEPHPAAHRILVVDDEEIVLVALSEALRRERYEVVTVSNPLVALEMLRQETFSVILIDHEMPLLTGLELLAQAKEIQPDTPRILITAVLRLDTVINAINKGEVFRFIVKPWLREELLVTVKNAVQRFELMRQHAQLQARAQTLSEQVAHLNQALCERDTVVSRQDALLTELNRTLDQNRQRSLEFCWQTLRSFHRGLAGQTRRVVQVCKAVTSTPLLAPEERRVLESSAFFHDLGLISLPRRVITTWLENPSRLTDDERAALEQHPVLSQQLAGVAELPPTAGLAIRAHHERYDGQGYPDRLAGENVPWLGRLLAAAVCYAAPPGDGPAAVQAVKAASGTALDPRAVDAVLHALARLPAGRPQREVSLDELRPGMVLAHGIYSANGLLLIPEGQELDSAFIERLEHHYCIQPPPQSLTVYC